MQHKHKPVVLAVLFLVGFLLFFYLGFNVEISGPSYTQNCTDVAGEYHPCELHGVKYGIPFNYAEGHPYIPGNSYSHDDVRVMPLLGNAAIWILPLPLVYMVVTRKR